jgi:hypothetical protein
MRHKIDLAGRWADTVDHQVLMPAPSTCPLTLVEPLSDRRETRADPDQACISALRFPGAWIEVRQAQPRLSAETECFTITSTTRWSLARAC